jgi:hypothetical protein
MTRKHIIVRGVTNDSRTPVALDPSIDLSKIARVHHLLDEKLYREIGTLHWRSTFLEDKMHDWDVRRGQFFYYAHSCEKGDVVDLVLEIAE